MSQQTVFITGASSGLGLAFSHIFAKEGYICILVARDKEALVALAQELKEKYNAFCVVLPKDLAQQQAAEELFKETTEKDLLVDVLINNAGFATHGAFPEIPLNEEVSEIRVNIEALTALTKLFLPQMITKKKGRILHVASTAAFQPGPFMAVYYSTKAYVLSFSEALSEELKHTGVSVTALCPGPMRTGFVKRAGVENTPIFQGRLLKSDDVARIGYEGLMQGKRVIIPGKRDKFLRLFASFIPHRVSLPLIAKLSK